MDLEIVDAVPTQLKNENIHNILISWVDLPPDDPILYEFATAINTRMCLQLVYAKNVSKMCNQSKVT